MKQRGEGTVRPDFDVQRWAADMREQYRPDIERMMLAFDTLPRRPDEEQWRAALVEEILDMFQEGLRSPAFGSDPDLAGMEAELWCVFQRFQARVRSALAERRGATNGTAATP